MTNISHRKSQLEEIDSAFQSLCDLSLRVQENKNNLAVKCTDVRIDISQSDQRHEGPSAINILKDNIRVLYKKVQENSFVHDKMRNTIITLTKELNEIKAEKARYEMVKQDACNQTKSLHCVAIKLYKSEMENYRLRRELHLIKACKDGEGSNDVWIIVACFVLVKIMFILLISTI